MFLSNFGLNPSLHKKLMELNTIIAICAKMSYSGPFVIKK